MNSRLRVQDSVPLSLAQVTEGWSPDAGGIAGAATNDGLCTKTVFSRPDPMSGVTPARLLDGGFGNDTINPHCEANSTDGGPGSDHGLKGAGRAPAVSDDCKSR